MRLVFSGAAHEVTGSCHYLEVGTTKFLVDCGMEQGVNIYENVEPPVPWSDIQFVLLTHSHIDHVGMLPYIYARGFKGRVIATNATCDLCNIMLKDSAHIQEMDAEWKNRKARRAGLPEIVPMYDLNDVQGVMQHFVPCDYDHKIVVCDEITVRFRDAGHLLGSASIEVWVTEQGVTKKLVFSGDIGNTNQPIIKNPHYIKDADYVIMESTYGDRSHGPRPDYIKELTAIIQRTFDRGGNVVIPSFAVGRTQEMLYFIRQIKAEGLVKNHDNFEVYVDSPLAVEATNVFNRSVPGYYDDDAMALIKQGINPISFPGLKTAVTSDDSIAINVSTTPKVIISASGMCDAGRIRHHLKHNLWRPECTIVFAGYQAVGTLGRSLVDGTDQVRLFGETIEVKAQIRMMEGLSGHADQDGLIRWIRAYKEKPKMTFIVHGDDKVCDIFADRLNREEGIPASAPFSGSVYDLAEGCWLKVTRGIPIQPEKESRRRADGIFARLVAAGERLCRVIKRNEGGANKDLAKFTDQIHALCDKWDR